MWVPLYAIYYMLSIFLFGIEKGVTMTDRVPMTKEGHQSLQEELKRLKSIERPAVIQAIAEARAHGDLSENAEYSAAKEKQSFVEGRIN